MATFTAIARHPRTRLSERAKDQDRDQAISKAEARLLFAYPDIPRREVQTLVVRTSA